MTRLKSLELHGYKTFASRTPFEFAGTVTAIVGPNGSGKSNIADALRWVLGEQSYSLLRGKKTEDMIFAGSEHRSRAGMASATVVFDNSDGWLPIDFTEVAIARRAYRDGQNEYLLNGQRVRLRDVSELLSQSGLAERTYTIIGQGLVDAALALKAEERRRLFEEAAGIGLHRSRREEALRRLETTRRNLDRVQDILAELQPRLRSLERQARRAQEYEQVKADLRVILREWYGYHWHRAQTDLTEAREAAREKELLLGTTRAKQSALDQQLQAFRDQIHGMRARLNSWHRQSAQLHSRREKASLDLAVIEERLRSLEEQRQVAGTELDRAAEEIALHKDRVANAAQEVKHLEIELAEAQSHAEAAHLALHERRDEREVVENLLQTARASLVELIANRSHLSARVEERKAHSERQCKHLEEAILLVNQAEEALHEAKARHDTSAQALREAEAAQQEVETALKSQQSRLAVLENARAQALEARSAQRAEVARLRAELEVLDQAEQALTGYASGTRTLLQAARQSRLRGARGAFSNFLEVPAELETAIAAVLGEFVDAVLLEKGTDSDEALDILAGEASRGALLPLDSLSPEPPLRLVDNGFTQRHDLNEGILGVAADLVSAPPDFRAAVDLLLGQVVVVSNRAVARQLLAGQGDGVRVVTLRGEVFHAKGPIQVGQEGQPGTLSRPRQRRELQQNLAEAQVLAEAVDKELEVLKNELEELKTAGEQLARNALIARQAAEKANSTYNHDRLKVEQARRQAQWQSDQRIRLEAEIKNANIEVASISADLSNIEAETLLIEQVVREQLSTLASLPLDEFQAQLSHWNMRAAVAQHTVADARSRQGEYGRSLEKAIQLEKALQERQVEIEATIHHLNTQKASLRLLEAEIGEQIEALRVQIDPAEKELVDIEAGQSSIQIAEGEARQAVSTAEHYHAQARINLARRQEALDSLRRRIEDDFGLVAFEYADEISGPTPLPLEGMVEQLPRVMNLPVDIEDSLKRQRAQLRRMGAINPEAQAEYQEVSERYQFLTDQVKDLNKAEADIRQVIAELDRLMEREFYHTFEAVAVEFRQIFNRLFGGGAARLVLTDPDDLTSTGIDIEARLPGRREQGLSLLSGGERSLTATALVFALLRVSPTPFCVLDEVDAMLDEANVGRFRELLRELSQSTQFIIITHNRNTVQVADVIYGVTMDRDSASQVISLKLDEIEQIV